MTKKRTSNIMHFAAPTDHNKKSEKKDKYLALAREVKKVMEHEGDSDTSCNCCTGNVTHRLSKMTNFLLIYFYFLTQASAVILT